MKEIKYDRLKAVEYAKKWAFSRNPRYYNFDMVGGDCTSFVSQCIYEGSKVMNDTKDLGWYYIDGNHKSPSWSGVEFLYQFLISNKGIGPHASIGILGKLDVGDVIQLSFDGQSFVHSTIIVDITNESNLSGIKIASHTYDSFNKSIIEYDFQKIRLIHIDGVRK